MICILPNRDELAIAACTTCNREIKVLVSKFSTWFYETDNDFLIIVQATAKAPHKIQSPVLRIRIGVK